MAAPKYTAEASIRHTIRFMTAKPSMPAITLTLPEERLFADF